MPALIPVIVPLIAAGVGATELGMNLAGVGKPSQGDAQKQLQQAQEQQAAADAASKRKAILASMANAQEQGGGALSNPSLTDLASVIAGVPGEGTTSVGRGALTQYLGLPSGDTMVGATNQALSGAMQ